MPKTTPITNETTGDIVTLKQNAAGILTSILRARVPDGAEYTIKNQTVAEGALYNGALIVVDLRNANGDRIQDGRLLVGYEGTNAEFTTWVRGIPLSVWGDLSTSDQKNSRYRATLAQSSDLNVGPALILPARTRLVIGLDSAEVIDWSKSYFEILVDEASK